MPTKSAIKVLHLGKFYPPYRGGMETHLKSLCEESIEFNVEPTVFVANDRKERSETNINGVRVVRFSRTFDVSGAPICIGLSALIRSSHKDVLHLHHPNPGASLAFLNSRFKGPSFVTYHSDIVRQKKLAVFYAPILNLTLKRCSAIIATSPQYAKSSPVLKRFLHKTEIIPLGNPLNLDVAKFNESGQAAQELREKYGSPLVLGVGRLIYYKGFEYAIRAIAETKANLLLVGQGPLLDHLKEESRKAGVEDRVFFLGDVSDEIMAAAYKACDIFLMSSVERSEAFGLVQLEAMSFGKPIINTNLDSGVPFVSVNNKTGLTVAPRDDKAISDAINLLLNDSKLRQKLGDSARIRAETEFSPRLMAQRTCHLYKKFMGKLQ